MRKIDVDRKERMAQQAEREKDSVSLKDLSREFDTAYITLWNWAVRGIIPTFRTDSNKLRVNKSDLPQIAKLIQDLKDRERISTPNDFRVYRDEMTAPYVSLALVRKIGGEMRAGKILQYQFSTPAGHTIMLTFDELFTKVTARRISWTENGKPVAPSWLSNAKKK